MAKITASEVNALRKTTGAGMMDCKNALVEADGDSEKAIKILRKKGQKIADKRADRDAAEGVIIAKVSDDKKFGAVVRISCETDFVAKNSEFVDFVTSVLDFAVAGKISDVDALKNAKNGEFTIAELVLDRSGKIGEKIEIVDYQTISDEMVFSYIHTGNRLATIMGLSKADVADIETIGKEVNMQIAAMAPIALDKDGVDAETVKKEIEIGMDQARREGKPEAMLEKIAMGKLGRFYRDNTLLAQKFVRNNKISVEQYLKDADKDLTVTKFYRLTL